MFKDMAKSMKNDRIKNELKCLHYLRELIARDDSYIVITIPFKKKDSRAIPQTFSENKPFKDALLAVCDAKISELEKF